MEWLIVISKCHRNGYDAITCKISNSHNITTGGAHVPTDILMLSSKIRCKEAFKDGIVHDHIYSWICDLISQIFHLIFNNKRFALLILMMLNIDAMWNIL